MFKGDRFSVGKLWVQHEYGQLTSCAVSEMSFPFSHMNLNAQKWVQLQLGIRLLEITRLFDY